MKEIRPWYRWFPNDYTRSQRVLRFGSLAVHGAYRNLLDAMWNWEGKLPTDRSILWRLALANSREEYEVVADQVEEMFQVSKDGRFLTHDRLTEEWDNASNFMERQSKAGRASAEAKRNRNQTATPVEPQSNGASSISSTVHNNTSNTERGETAPLVPDQTDLGFSLSSERPDLNAALNEVWDYYIAKTGKNPNLYEFTDKRRQKGMTRMKESLKKWGSVDKATSFMKLSVDGILRSDWNIGKNSSGEKHLDWCENLFPNFERMEKWWNNA